MRVFIDGLEVGEVSSGVVSPLLDTGLALGFLDASVQIDSECTIEVRGKHEPGIVVNKRFYRRGA